jgi:hypothetical protein
VYDLDTAAGDQLNKIGAVLGEVRAGRGDADYRRILRVRIRALRSEGQILDLQEVSLIWQDLPDATGAVHIREYFPHFVEVRLEDGPVTEDPLGLWRWLHRSKAASIRLVLIYRTTETGHFRFGFEDDAPEIDGARGFGSIYDATAGAPLAGAVASFFRGPLSDPTVFVTLGGDTLITLDGDEIAPL